MIETAIGIFFASLLIAGASNLSNYPSKSTKAAIMVLFSQVVVVAVALAILVLVA